MEDKDFLFDDVVKFVTETRKANISHLQRKFRIGYNRAARLVEQLTIDGVISEPSINGTRDVLTDPNK